MTEYVDGTIAPLIHIFIADTPSHPRGLFARALLRRLILIIERGRREDREPVGSYGPSCREQIACASMHSGKQGNRRHPGLPCAVVGTAYVALSPGSDAPLPPSPCGWLMPAPGQAQYITARLGAQTPGNLLTRKQTADFVPLRCNGMSIGFSGRLRLPVDEFDPDRGRGKGRRHCVSGSRPGQRTMSDFCGQADIPMGLTHAGKCPICGQRRVVDTSLAERLSTPLSVHLPCWRQPKVNRAPREKLAAQVVQLINACYAFLTQTL
ncbi:hypothetical protein SAMN05216338_108615 [Bradyrhizobium sp. Rc2d]|nr:hypothetical protein SAMN05216338_108615 [Bradyrhizobium sp. Rc2d]